MSSSGLSVNDIMSDINQVLLKHLNSIVNKYENDRNQFEDFLRNIPLVKNVIEENKSLKKLVKLKEEQIQFLDSNIKSLSKMYSSVVLRNKRFECKVNDPIKNFGIEIRRELSLSHKKNTDTPDKQNITLEVDDNEKETNISEQEIEDEVESNLHKQQQEFLKSITINNNDENNNQSDDDSHDLWEGQLEDYNYDDAEEGADEEEEDADEEGADEDAEEEKAEEEAEEDADEEEEEEDEEEVIEIMVDGKLCYGNEKKIGDIYEYLEDGDVGEEIGKYVNGEAILF